MTREQAIDILKNAAWLGTDKDREQTETAVEMAISALEQPCETSTDEPITMVYPTIFCDDAISLDDAKEIIARNDSTNGKIAVFTGKQVQQMLDTLPRILTKPIECDDAISREEATAKFEIPVNTKWKRCPLSRKRRVGDTE